jgi:hypothetical protein
MSRNAITEYGNRAAELPQEVLSPDTTGDTAVTARPSSDESRLGTAIAQAAQTRLAGSAAQAYAYGGADATAWFYTPNRQLSGARDHHLEWETNNDGSVPRVPEGEWVVNWGNTPTCNVFVYDVLFLADANPPLKDGHYYSAGDTVQRAGSLRTYLNEVLDNKAVVPGDIAVLPMRPMSHMEVVLSAPDPTTGRFSAAGAHSDGASQQQHKLDEGWKFFRVR